MLLQIFLKFILDDGLWRPPIKTNQHTIKVLDHNIMVGEISLARPKLFLRGDMKLLFKYNIILEKDIEGRLVKSTKTLRNNLKSLHHCLEMKHGQLLSYLKN